MIPDELRERVALAVNGAAGHDSLKDMIIKVVLAFGWMFILLYFGRGLAESAGWSDQRSAQIAVAIIVLFHLSLVVALKDYIRGFSAPVQHFASAYNTGIFLVTWFTELQGSPTVVVLAALLMYVTLPEEPEYILIAGKRRFLQRGQHHASGRLDVQDGESE